MCHCGRRSTRCRLTLQRGSRRDRVRLRNVEESGGVVEAENDRQKEAADRAKRNRERAWSDVCRARSAIVVVMHDVAANGPYKCRIEARRSARP